MLNLSALNIDKAAVQNFVGTFWHGQSPSGVEEAKEAIYFKFGMLYMPIYYLFAVSTSVCEHRREDGYMPSYYDITIRCWRPIYWDLVYTSVPIRLSLDWVWTGVPPERQTLFLGMQKLDRPISECNERLRREAMAA